MGYKTYVDSLQSQLSQCRSTSKHNVVLFTKFREKTNWTSLHWAYLSLSMSVSLAEETIEDIADPKSWVKFDEEFEATLIRELVNLEDRHQFDEYVKKNLRRMYLRTHLLTHGATKYMSQVGLNDHPWIVDTRIPVEDNVVWELLLGALDRLFERYTLNMMISPRYGEDSYPPLSVFIESTVRIACMFRPENKDLDDVFGATLAASYVVMSQLNDMPVDLLDMFYNYKREHPCLTR